MYEFLKGSPKVIIDLPSGLFSFQRQSAAGKTYLAAACDYVPDPYKDFYTRLVCVRYLRILERLDMKEAYSQVCREVENGAS